MIREYDNPNASDNGTPEKLREAVQEDDQVVRKVVEA